MTETRRPGDAVLPPVRRTPGSSRRAAKPARSSIVGRAGELGQLQQELAQAAAGEFRFVLIQGDAGIGKSRLLREVADTAPAESIVLTARGYPLGAGVSFGLWIDALEPFLASLTDVEIRDVCGQFLADLVAILPRVADLGGTRTPSARPLLAEGLTRILDSLSLRATVVVILDDLHLADPSSWETVRRIARRLPARPILVVGTTRPAELARDEVAAHVLFELDQDGMLQRLALEALPALALSELAAGVLGRTPSPALTQWLAERSEGNPLYARGLLRALVDEGADLNAPRLRRLPEDLVDRVRSRMGQLPEPLQRVLELIAVAGRPVTLRELEALADHPPDQLATQLDELIAAGALVEDEEGRELTYSLSHSLVREALYSDIGGARRRALHRLIARTLDQGGKLAEAAVHFARSANVGDPEALDTLLRAVAQAERRNAYREAMALIAELVELLPDNDERWRAVYDAVVWDADWVVDHRSDSHGAVGVRAMRAIDALFCATGEPPARRAAVKFRLASFLAWGTGELPEAAAECAAATHLFAEAGDRRAELLSAREEAFIAGLRGDFAAMAAQARRVLVAAEAEDLPLVAMQAHQALGYGLGFLGRLSEAEHAGNRVVDIAMGDAKLYRATAGLGVLGWLRACSGDVSGALSLFDRARALNPEYRDSILVEQQILVGWLSGNVRSALEAAHQVVAWSPTGVSLRRAHGMALGAIAAVECDQAQSAADLMGRAERDLGDREWSVFAPLNIAAAAMCRWHTGGATEAVPGLAAAADRLMTLRALPWALMVVAEFADAAAEGRDSDALVRACEHLEVITATMTAPGPAGILAWATGRQLLLQGDIEGAGEAASLAVSRLEETQWQGHLARALRLRGHAARDRHQSARYFEQAALLYERNGARWRLEHVLADLRRTGSAGRRAADAVVGPTSLSPRELDVARMAATGLSARDIARQLVLSERTIETHLSRAYRKLGVESKLELVRRATELGL